MSESKIKTLLERNMAKRSSVDRDPTHNRPDSDGKKRKLEEKEHLSFLEMEAELLQKLEEAKAEADFYKLKCRNKKEELKKWGQREEELLAEIMRTKRNAEIYKREAELHDENLLIWIHPSMPRKRALARPASGEGSCDLEEVVCCPKTGYPTAVCRLCGEEEACVVLHPCNHLCVCLECESQTDRCPTCRSPKTGWFWN